MSSLPKLGPICPSDLGLKAAFWSGKDGEDVSFRRILGWITVSNYVETDGDGCGTLRGAGAEHQWQSGVRDDAKLPRLRRCLRE
jgi:hypothetical protein